MMSRAGVSWGLLAAAALGGCQSATVEDRVRQHVVVVDPDGHPIDPRDNRSPLYDPKVPLDSERSGFRQQVAGMMRAMDETHRNVPANEPRKILIYVHGGMNTLDEARGNAMRVYQAMAAAPETAAEYPILIDWQSDFVSTYLEQMRFIRQGTKDQGRISGPLTAPLYLFGDLGRAAAGAPVTWLNQGTEDAQTLAGAIRGGTEWSSDPAWANPRLDTAARFFLRLNERYRADFGNNVPRAIAVSVGKNRIEWPEWAARSVSYTATIPLKLATGPLITGVGKTAWENMYRRTSTMFESPDAFVTEGRSDEEIDAFLDRGSIGAVSMLLYELAQKTEQTLPLDHRDKVPPTLRRAVAQQEETTPGAPSTQPQAPGYEITIVAHSMGSIVANNMLRRFPHLPVKNIVYMGAACTISDLRSSVVPFLQQPEHADTRFYNLCLHPIAETLDTEAYDFVPRGSLLVWIDAFLENPRTPLDRTLGRWENVIQATYIFPEEIRGRVHIKSFDLLGWDATPAELAANPQKHGDFTRKNFWVSSFWQPGPPLGAETKLHQQLEKKAREEEAKPENLMEGLKRLVPEGEKH
jgi:hypothetical protein